MAINSIVADTHVHLYPFYDLELALRSTLSRLAVYSSDKDLKSIFLTERSDCSFFKNLLSGNVQLKFAEVELSDVARLVFRDGTGELVIVPGRQIATKERLEILALTKDVSIPDGLSLEETLAHIKDSGAAPVLNWAPGKWLFSRGKVLDDLLAKLNSKEVLLGDVSLRPRGYPLPQIMRKAEERGFRIIAGSDPLPFCGEEKRIGSYGVKLSAEFNFNSLGEDIRRALFNGDITLIGKRDSILEVMLRLFKNKRAKPLHN